MSNKVIIGLGIGCGVILLGVVGVFVAGGIWAKNTFGGTVEAAKKMQDQEKDLVALNRSHPFKAPAEGEVLALDEQRLATYLSVREASLPVFKSYEEKSKAFQEKHKTNEEGAQPGLDAALEATNLLMALSADVRAAYIAGLKEHQMSPAEFQAITGTVYASMVADSTEALKKMGAQSKKMMEKQLAELDKRLESGKLSDEERTETQQARDDLKQSMDALDEELGGSQGELSAEAKKNAAANVALLKKYEDRVKTMANVAFDGFVMGGAANEMGASESDSESED
ncbi:hypothetical protein LZ198_04990 [Myxococcus sp. K15C18031901]|uniref:hypothetical protein n=1 Tax=Myxococcus dinghuensis TaxID=2906761 RepID=UPI0020A7DA62|nr:hypothetical protein [Myxococcus dinghuensis]MCP3098232.1 hypothetical protein [Myxococcus dinghuensis]